MRTSVLEARHAGRPRFLASSSRARVAMTAALLMLCAVPAHALSNRVLINPKGAANGDNFGLSVASAGDFNGDGNPDVIVGAPLNDANGASAGRAYIFYGGPRASNVPDVTLTGLAAGDEFGISVASAGDFNGDGFDDVIVGAEFAGGTGRAYIFYGGASPDNVADLTLFGQAAGDEFTVVGSAGDLNGDGFDDVIVGAPLNDAAGLNAGRAYVYFGGPTPNNIADLTFTGEAAGDFFGCSVRSAGDFNGDGFDDVIIGASHNDAGGVDAGKVYISFGRSLPFGGFNVTFTGSAAGDNFGSRVAGGGDFNGDGYADVIIGAPFNDAGGTNAGRAYVQFGGPRVIAPLLLTGSVAGDDFGASVAEGDMNHDGFADVIVGADLNGSGGAEAGQAYVYLGSSAPNSTADVILTGVASLDQFGSSVASAGDFDGDGFSDVVVGAPFSFEGGGAGQAYVFAIYPYQVICPNGGDTWVVGNTATVRWRGAGRADIYLSTDGGMTWQLIAASEGGAPDFNQTTVPVPDEPTTNALLRVVASGEGPNGVDADQSDRVFRIVPSNTSPCAANRLQLSPTGLAAGDDFGYSVASAGDVNGDGYADVIVGAPLNDAGGTSAGRAYIFFGGPGADGVADVVLSGAAAGDEFGYSVASAGDVNGDGFADVIVGAPFNSAAGSFAGRAYVFFGGSPPHSVPDLVLTGEAAGDHFGTSVASAGDVNDDGFADLVVGAPLNGAGGSLAGRAYVFLGGAAPDAVADVTLTGPAPSAKFGTSVAGAGDVNGDGRGDVIVGAPQFPATSVLANAYVYYGGSPMDAVADLHFAGETPGDQFGISVASAGDVDVDGFADVIVGANLNSGAGLNAGRAYVFFGGPAADCAAPLVLNGEAAGDQFGISAASAGDVNGDGCADLIVGASLNDAGGTSAGRAYVFYGGPGADANPDVVLTGQASGDLFGSSVASAGDVNRDGFSDVIMGASLNDFGGGSAGRAYLYDFNRYFLQVPNGGEIWDVGSTHTVTWRGCELADLYLSVDGGATYLGVARAVGGADLNSYSLLVPNLPTRFALMKVAPDDLTVRGSDQSDALFTIQATVTLLSFDATFDDAGASISWSTDPGVGPEGLLGYRLYRIARGATGTGQRIGPELLVQVRYTDPDATPGDVYRLTSVNGLEHELELGRVTLQPGVSGLLVWPSPVTSGNPIRVAFAAPVGALDSPKSDVDVGVFDLMGARIATLSRSQTGSKSGVVSLAWDGRQRNGAPLTPGVYFVRVAAPSTGFKAVRRLVVVR